MTDLDLLAKSIAAATGRAFKITAQRSVSGGCINRTTYVTDGSRCFFVKENATAFAAAFRAEALGLAALAATGTIRVPAVVAQIQSDTQSYLILEYISQAQPSTHGWQVLGEQLAALHAQPQAYFGWHCDNFIGATPQPNPRHGSWSEFFRSQRLEHQFKLGQKQGMTFNNSDRVLRALTETLANHHPIPSLLHGDLWAGNVAFDASGHPFLFDPACYFGDRETDLAFSEFFGGFAPGFYTAYRAEYPLDAGYAQRKQFYNLYHCLNHAVLFGGSYINQARDIIRQLSI